MEPEHPVMQGLLLFPPQGVLGQLKKTWQKRFCQLYNASKFGIERLEIFDSTDEALSQQRTPRIITLEACVKIAPSNQPNVFTVITRGGSHHFGCHSESEMSSWFKAFQVVAFKDSVCDDIIEEDNDLYSISGEGIFIVTVVESKASKACGLEARDYTLRLCDTDMKLSDGDTTLFVWPYQFIRKYGRKCGQFTFEAGRKCNSGEGSFQFMHTYGEEIFRCIASKMRLMKKQLKGELSPSMESSDMSFHSAFSMAPGSRSPLSPSSNAGNLIDLDFPSMSQNSARYSTSSPDSISSVKQPPPVSIRKSIKLPRKPKFPPLLVKKNMEPDVPDPNVSGIYKKLNTGSLPESSRECCDRLSDKDAYDTVEVRSDAWKTHGIDNIPHMEMGNRPDDLDDGDRADYEALRICPSSTQNSGRRKPSGADMVITPTCPIIHNHVPNRADPSEYDRLQHFGSTPRLDNANNGYKKTNLQIKLDNHASSALSTITPVANTKSSSSWSDYDYVKDMSSVRLADDSHLGYATVRKKTPPPVSKGPEHNVYNEVEYAIVSKPKLV